MNSSLDKGLEKYDAFIKTLHQARGTADMETEI